MQLCYFIFPVGKMLSGDYFTEFKRNLFHRVTYL